MFYHCSLQLTFTLFHFRNTPITWASRFWRRRPRVLRMWSKRFWPWPPRSRIVWDQPEDLVEPERLVSKSRLRRCNRKSPGVARRRFVSSRLGWVSKNVYFVVLIVRLCSDFFSLVRHGITSGRRWGPFWEGGDFWQIPFSGLKYEKVVFGVLSFFFFLKKGFAVSEIAFHRFFLFFWCNEIMQRASVFFLETLDVLWRVFFVEYNHFY